MGTAPVGLRQGPTICTVRELQKCACRGEAGVTGEGRGRRIQPPRRGKSGLRARVDTEGGLPGSQATAASARVGRLCPPLALVIKGAEPSRQNCIPRGAQLPAPMASWRPGSGEAPSSPRREVPGTASLPVQHRNGAARARKEIQSTMTLAACQLLTSCSS